MIGNRTRQVEDENELALYTKRDISLVRGDGVNLWDEDGRHYLDMMSNFGVNILGHAHPDVTAAITEQAARLTNCHQSFYNDARASFIEALEALLGAGWRLSFANSGAEAIEAALKYARAATGRQRFVAARRGYHGRTFGAMSVGGEPRANAAYAPLLEGSTLVPFGDADAAREAMAGAAAMVVEPVQGESGVRPAPDGYLQALRSAADETGALLILDEVQTALRTGTPFAWQHWEARPDIMTLSKSLANGLPIGVTVVRSEVADQLTPGGHGTTFGGNPLVCAAGTATLRIAGDPAFQQRVRERGDLFLALLRQRTHSLVREVRGLGLMAAVELRRNASPVLRHMQEHGVLAIPAGSTCVRFLPPLIVEEDHLRQAASALWDALDAVAAAD